MTNGGRPSQSRRGMCARSRSCRRRCGRRSGVLDPLYFVSRRTTNESDRALPVSSSARASSPLRTPSQRTDDETRLVDAVVLAWPRSIGDDGASAFRTQRGSRHGDPNEPLKAPLALGLLLASSSLCLIAAAGERGRPDAAGTPAFQAHAGGAHPAWPDGAPPSGPACSHRKCRLPRTHGVGALGAPRVRVRPSYYWDWGQAHKRDSALRRIRTATSIPSARPPRRGLLSAI